MGPMVSTTTSWHGHQGRSFGRGTFRAVSDNNCYRRERRRRSVPSEYSHHIWGRGHGGLLTYPLPLTSGMARFRPAATHICIHREEDPVDATICSMGGLKMGPGGSIPGKNELPLRTTYHSGANRDYQVPGTSIYFHAVRLINEMLREGQHACPPSRAIVHNKLNEITCNDWLWVQYPPLPVRFSEV